MNTVAHLTSVHPRYDTRIFLKECASLARVGYQVSLVVSDGEGSETRNSVSIYDVGASRGRLDRIWNTTRKVFHRAVELDADIYHLHDPELIPVGLKLKKLGKTVVFDAHEDVPKQLLSKHYLNLVTRWFLSKSFSIYERWACRKLDGIIGATPFIRDRFFTIHSNSVNINNYPMLGELSVEDIDWSQKANEVCYVGGIASIRGIKEVVAAIGKSACSPRLQLAGKFSESKVEQSVRSDAGWENVDSLGYLNREEVRNVLQRSVAGLVTFHPLPNHIDSQPNKMFEYMSAGVPVIASNFPLWREIIEGSECGLCVNPLDYNDIARAIDYLISHPEEAEQMGHKGQRAVQEQFNWSIEEKKLFGFYESLLN